MDTNLKISLAAARVNAGMTQKEAAQKLGVSNKTLISWEHGESFPSVMQADEIYELYNRPKDSIFFSKISPKMWERGQ